ncbi:hypothetical protein E2562_008964 [Oryza meyeriana var. granulata]|uniref:Uncharacterized protein n=1 Tax=Oryza meyeriana var. granulata TaxID=110450 RepID=A0A6G1D0M4_9ORYZ|nr:hypothetical protein E2562_008964 [Oryza meyeriana var. granulata]
METSGSGGEPGRPWTASATWAPAGCSAVEDAVSFETSADDAEAVPSAVVLERPAPDGDGDAPPCEVTVHFRGKYEIHRVYMRSTARIYEIYYTTDPKDNCKDYLCTVRCGLAVKEPLPSAEESMAQWSSDASTSEKHEHETKSMSSSIDEDSWVDVKIPELHVEKNRSKSQEPNMIGARQETTLAHYEATAEITDASPFVSLTVRLLSLQSKTSVHIEEIYIFADPIETTNEESETRPGNMGGSSLLAMLVPSLMQMSKSRSQKTDNRYFSDASRTKLSQGCAMEVNSPCENVVREAGSCVTNDLNFKSAGMESKENATDSGAINNEEGNHYEFQLKDSKSLLLPVQTTENTQVPLVKNQSVSNTHQPVTPLMDENLNPYSRIEGKLDTLLSKLEKMESYCSKFDDGMMRPLSSIESRLQQLELQFGAFTAELKSLRASSARMSAPDGLSDMSHPQHKTDNDGKAENSASATNRQPGLVVRAPEFSLEESFSYDKSNENPVTLHGPSMMPRLLVKAPDFVCESELACEKLHDGSFSAVDFALSSEKESKTSPGLVVKVPEFPNDEDDEVEEEKEAEVGDHDDGHTKSDAPLSESAVDNSKGKTPVSVDGALASVLEALLSSTKKAASSQSVDCPASNSTAENTNDSSTCSFSSEQVDEISTNDGSAGQFSSTFGDANKVDTFISCQEADAAPQTYLSKENLDEKVEVNNLNNDLNSNMMAFVASTEPLCVSSQFHTVEESNDVGNQVNRQNNGSNSDMMPSAANTHIIAPSQHPVLESINDGPPFNDDRSTLPLAKFLLARNDNSSKNVISEAFSGNGSAEMHTFKRASVESAKNLMDISQFLLLQKALEVNEDDNGRFSISGQIDSCCLRAFTDSKKRWTESSSLEASLNDSFTKPEVAHSSDLSSMESFSGEPAREAVGSGGVTTGNCVDDLFTGGSTVNQAAREELQKVYDLLYEYKKDVLGMAFVAKRTSKSSPSLEVLLAESSDLEEEISDVKDTDNDAGFGSARLFSTFSSSDDEAPRTDEPIIDVVDLATPSDANASSKNELIDDEPLLDVDDLPISPETYASVLSDTHQACVDDQSKHSGTFGEEGNGKYTYSLI